MVDQRTKDPDRVRLGRLGALTVHARGRTNVAPARAAWEADLAREFGISDDLDPDEHARRMRAALRVRMSRLARTRWGKKKAVAEVQRPATAEPEAFVDGPDELPPTRAA
jgi:hypothetical protein